jgi:hypothetical protein
MKLACSDIWQPGRGSWRTHRWIPQHLGYNASGLVILTARIARHDWQHSLYTIERASATAARPDDEPFFLENTDSNND